MPYNREDALRKYLNEKTQEAAAEGPSLTSPPLDEESTSHATSSSTAGFNTSLTTSQLPVRHSLNQVDQMWIASACPRCQTPVPPMHRFPSPSHVSTKTKSQPCHLRATCQLRGSEGKAPGCSHIQSHLNPRLPPRKTRSTKPFKSATRQLLNTKCAPRKIDFKRWTPAGCTECINYLSAALQYCRNKSMCQHARRLPDKMQYITHIATHTHTHTHTHERERERREILPGWNILWK